MEPEIIEIVEKIGLQKIYEEVLKYVKSRVKGESLKYSKALPEGHDAESIAQEAITRFLEGRRTTWDRNWSAEELINWLKYDVAKSILSHTFGSRHAKNEWPVRDEDLPEVLDEDFLEEEVEYAKRLVEELLEEFKDDEELLGVFECVWDGDKKAAVIAKRLNYDINRIYRIKEKMLRRAKTVEKRVKKDFLNELPR